MKEKLVVLLLAVTMIMSAVGCGAPNDTDDSAADAQIEEEETDVREKELSASMEEGEDTEEAGKEEGYVTEGDGYKATVRWCTNGDKNIFGTLYVPEGYDGTQKYPTVIMSHGFGDSHTAYDAYAPLMAAQGIVCYVFDFCTGGAKSFSDGEATEYSVITETEDLKSVMDFVKTQECVDDSQLILMGQSMGGLVSALAAAERRDEIAELILFYPAFVIGENMHADYPSAEDLPKEPGKYLGADVGPIFFSDIYDVDIYGTIGAYTGSVLLLHGTADILVPIEYSEKALEVYSDAQLQVIEGGNHGFPPLEDGTNVREIAYGHIMDFLAANGVVGQAE